MANLRLLKEVRDRIERERLVVRMEWWFQERVWHDEAGVWEWISYDLGEMLAIGS